MIGSDGIKTSRIVAARVRCIERNSVKKPGFPDAQSDLYETVPGLPFDIQVKERVIYRYRPIASDYLSIWWGSSVSWKFAGDGGEKPGLGQFHGVRG